MANRVLHIAVLMVAIGGFFCPQVGANESRGAGYQRTRQGAGSHYAPSGRHYGYGGYRSNFYYQPPVVSGSWYTRPYPYHFDYYRQRYAAPVSETDACPCAQGLQTEP